MSMWPRQNGSRSSRNFVEHKLRARSQPPVMAVTRRYRSECGQRRTRSLPRASRSVRGMRVSLVRDIGVLLKPTDSMPFRRGDEMLEIFFWPVRLELSRAGVTIDRHVAGRLVDDRVHLVVGRQLDDAEALHLQTRHAAPRVMKVG